MFAALCTYFQTGHMFQNHSLDITSIKGLLIKEIIKLSVNKELHYKELFIQKLFLISFFFEMGFWFEQHNDGFDVNGHQRKTGKTCLISKNPKQNNLHRQRKKRINIYPKMSLANTLNSASLAWPNTPQMVLSTL